MHTSHNIACIALITDRPSYHTVFVQTRLKDNARAICAGHEMRIRRSLHIYDMIVLFSKQVQVDQS